MAIFFSNVAMVARMDSTPAAKASALALSRSATMCSFTVFTSAEYLPHSHTHSQHRLLARGHTMVERVP